MAMKFNFFSVGLLIAALQFCGAFQFPENLRNPCNSPNSEVSVPNPYMTYNHVYMNLRSSIFESNRYLENVGKKIRLTTSERNIVRTKISEFPGTHLAADETNIQKGLTDLRHDYIWSLFLAIKSNLNYEASKTTTPEGSLDPYPGFNKVEWIEGLCFMDQYLLLNNVSLKYDMIDTIESYNLVNANDWSITQMELMVAASVSRNFVPRALSMLTKANENHTV